MDIDTVIILRYTMYTYTDIVFCPFSSIHFVHSFWLYLCSLLFASRICSCRLQFYVQCPGCAPRIKLTQFVRVSGKRDLISSQPNALNPRKWMGVEQRLNKRLSLARCVCFSTHPAPFAKTPDEPVEDVSRKFWRDKTSRNSTIQSRLKSETCSRWHELKA